jgi:hypothetical protein
VENESSSPEEMCRALFIGGRFNLCLELTAMEHRGSAKKGKEEFALFGLSKRLLAAVQVGRYKSP